MTEPDTPSKLVFQSRVCHTRELKIRQAGKKPFGRTELKGQWLQQAGFEIDAPVTLKVMELCIVLMPTPRRPTLMKQFSQLTPDQRQVIRNAVELMLKSEE